MGTVWHVHISKTSTSNTLTSSTRSPTHLRLLVHSGIPVRVIEDDTVCPGQVDAHATAASAKYERKVLRGRIEARHERLALGRFRAAVQPHVDVAMQVKKNL